MSDPRDARWRALERRYTEMYPGSDPRPLRRLIAEMRAAEPEAEAERVRQLRERGSISPLRGCPAKSRVDIQVEKCSAAVFLATPITHYGARWMHDWLTPRPKYLAWCNGLVMTQRDFSWLMRNKPADLFIRFNNYCDPELAVFGPR